MSAWIAIIAVAVGTYALRASMLVGFGDRALPAWMTRPMMLVAPAAVAALVSASLFVDAGALATPAVAEVAAVVAGFVAVRTSGKVTHAFVVGFPTFWLLSALVG